LELVEERRHELQDDPNRQRRWASQPTGWVALGIIGQDMRDEQRRNELQQRLIGDLSPAAQQHFQSLQGRERGRQLWNWAREALEPKFGPQDLQAYFASDKVTRDQREQLLGLPRAEMEARLEQMYVSSELGLPPGDFREWREWRQDRDGFGPGRGRGRDFDRGPRDGRDGPPRDGPPRDFDGRPMDRRFEGGPGRGRPPGPPPGRPPFGPPRPGGPPPEGGPGDWPPPPGPPPEDNGPPPQQSATPPDEQPI
jgi:hypothetical protein